MKKTTILQTKESVNIGGTNIHSFVSCYLLLLIFFISIVIIENKKIENSKKDSMHPDGFLKNSSLNIEPQMLTEEEKDRIAAKKNYQSLIKDLVPIHNILAISEDDNKLKPYLIAKLSFSFEEIYDQENSKYPNHKFQLIVQDLSQIQKKFMNYPMLISISYFVNDLENNKNPKLSKIPYSITQFFREGVEKKYINFILEPAKKDIVEIEMSVSM